MEHTILEEERQDNYAALFSKVLTEGEIEFAISQTYETIVCPDCGMEFLLFAVLRPDFENAEKGAEPQIILQVKCNHCPYCGVMPSAFKEGR